MDYDDWTIDADIGSQDLDPRDLDLSGIDDDGGQEDASRGTDRWLFDDEEEPMLLPAIQKVPDP